MRRLLATLLVLAALPAWCAAARAGEPAPAAQAGAVATAATVARPFGKRLGDAALSRQRGGAEVASSAALQGAVSGNQAVNVATGSNAIGGGAFAGAAGVPVVIQNSGNNVLIQSSTIVNVTLK